MYKLDISIYCQFISALIVICMNVQRAPKRSLTVKNGLNINPNKINLVSLLQRETLNTHNGNKKNS